MMTPMVMTLLSILALLVGFGFLIFVHELGHFLVAKAVGIKVTQFAIGFGPSLLAWRKGIGFRLGSTEAEYEKRLAEGADPATISETEYRLNYLAVLGGYVKMLGQEDLDPNAQSKDPRAYNNKPIWARAAVISAGVVMNIIFGMILFVVAFMMGVQFPPAVAGGVAPGTPAAQAQAVGFEDDPAYRGIQVGDRITRIDGEPIGDMMDLQLAVTLGKAGRPIEMTVQRPGHDEPLRYVMTAVEGDLDGRLSVGIAPSPDVEQVEAVIPHSPAAAAGVMPGMGVVAVNGQPVHTYGEYHRALTAARGEPVPVTFAPRADAGNNSSAQPVTVPLAAAPVMARDADGTPHLLGLTPATWINSVQKESPAEDAGVQAGDAIAMIDTQSWPTIEQAFDAIAEAAVTGEPVRMMVYRNGEMVTLKPIARDGSGPIGIVMNSWGGDGVIISHYLPGSPVAQFTPQRGSKLVSIAGRDVATWADAQRVLQDVAAAAGEVEQPIEIALTLELNLPERPREEVSVTLSPAQVAELSALQWHTPPTVGFMMLREPVVATNPWEATKLGVAKTVQFGTYTYVALLRLFEGSVKPSHLRGPVGIVDDGSQIVQHGGVTYLLFFLGLISVNLAVINFLPIPIVDGGHMVFLLIEKIKGSPPSARVQVAALYLGLALIAFVFVMVTYNDIARLITG